MNQVLATELGRRGWEEIYGRHIPGMSSPNAQGEMHCRCPFPDSHDRDRSFSVNSLTGLWFHFSTHRGGNYVMFRAIMEATAFDEGTGLAIPDFNGTERRILEEFGLARPIDPAWVAATQVALSREPAIVLELQRHKPWDRQRLADLGIGWDEESGRIVFPCQDRAGRLIAAKLYMPGGQPKMIWVPSGFGDNYLMPHTAWNETTLILVEGEPDMMTLRSYGFAGVCGTLGSGNPVPAGGWWRGKHIYVWTDPDLPGRDAEDEAVSLMRNDAATLLTVTPPDWEGRPANGDISDWVMWLQEQGMDREQIQRAIVTQLNDAVRIDPPSAILDEGAEDIAFAHALDAERMGRHVRFRARVSARSERRYMLPVHYRVTCPAQGRPQCVRCPMRGDFHGVAEFNHDPRLRSTLSLVQSTDEDQLQAIKEAHNIERTCPDPRLEVLQSVDVEPVILVESPDEGRETGGEHDRHRREALVIVGNAGRVDENRDYIMEGFPYATPKTQSAILLIDRAEPSGTAWDRWEPDAARLQAMERFKVPTGQDVLGRISDIADDLANSVTMIRGRPDMHMAYLAVWFSALKFSVGGAQVDRGWLECLVLGDTRCGKSVAFRRMSDWFGTGQLIDCKMQTPAGIMGSVVTSQQTGERYVVAGILPQNDAAGPVCFDEFHVPKWEGRRGLIEMLSSTRSEGVVRISKAASASFPARVRSIWLANPGLGELMGRLSLTGVELVQRLIPQPEDIARFDFALAVAQEDVDPDIINEVVAPLEPRYEQQALRDLLMWTWSRRPDQIEFTPGAIAHVVASAKDLWTRYDASVPLVEPADQRNRVSKLAVSVAAMCYSTSDDKQVLIVSEEHVAAAWRMLRGWFDKPSMGYDRYSQQARDDRTLENEEDVLQVFETLAAPNGQDFAAALLRLDEFSERTIGTLVPSSQLTIMARSVIQTLYHNRAIRLARRGRGDSYQLTPAAVSFLRRYVAGEVGGSNGRVD